MHRCVCLPVCMFTWMQVSSEAWDRRFPGAGVAVHCGPPTMGAEKRTLWFSGRPASALNSFTISPDSIVFYILIIELTQDSKPVMNDKVCYQRPCTMVLACNPSTWQAEAQGSKLQGRLGDIVVPCLNCPTPSKDKAIVRCIFLWNNEWVVLCVFYQIPTVLF